MVLVPTDTAGIEVVVNAGVGQDNMEDGDHAYLRYNDVRVPAHLNVGVWPHYGHRGRPNRSPQRHHRQANTEKP